MAQPRYERPLPNAGRPLPMTELAWRKEVVFICRLLWDKGYAIASDGNVSVKLAAGRYLVTPSGFSKGFIEPDQLLIVNDQLEVVGPQHGAARGLRPSSEMLLHLEAYRQRPDIGAVVHAHPPVAIALSIAGISLARCLLPEVVMTLGLIPTTDYATPASTVGAVIIRDLIQRYDALILQRHGSVTVARTPFEAYLKLEKLESAANITRMLVQLGQANPFPPEEVGKLVQWRHDKGVMKPGQAEDFCETCGVCLRDGQCRLAAR